MKKCPYCAEEIQDEAILCRYCHSDLSAPFPQGKASGPAAAGSGPAGGTTGAGATTGLGTGSAPSTSSLGASPTGSAGSLAEPSPTPVASSGPSGPTTSEPTTSSAPTGSATSTEAGGTDAGDDMWGVRSGAAPAGEQTAPSADTGSITYTHTGQQYVLGYGVDHFGIWSRQSPEVPTERFPRTDEGWRQAWTRYASLEPSNVPVEQATAQPTTAAPAASPGPSATAPIQSAGIGAPSGSAAMQYTHSGQRYLLGYGADFFGIWDRNQLSEPVRRYPRTDDGWRQAWSEFVAWEPNSVEVGIGG